MNEDSITALLDKYWRCETTLSEEQELRRYFSEEDLPETLEHYAPLFTYLKEERSPKLSSDFDQRLTQALQRADVPSAPHRSPLWAPLMRVAASILLIAGMGVSLFFITRQNNQPHYSEKGNEASQVMEQATYALEKLSKALLMSQEASHETLRQINAMEIDWELIDSLNSEEVRQQESNPAEDDTKADTVEQSNSTDSKDSAVMRTGYHEPIKEEKKI